MKLIVNEDVAIPMLSDKEIRFLKKCCVYHKEGFIKGGQKIVLSPSGIETLLNIIAEYNSIKLYRHHEHCYELEVK